MDAAHFLFVITKLPGKKGDRWQTEARKGWLTPGHTVSESVGDQIQCPSHHAAIPTYHSPSGTWSPARWLLKERWRGSSAKIVGSQVMESGTTQTPRISVC